MPLSPQFRYFLFHADRPVRQDDDTWKAPLPMNRKGEADAFSVTHGDYFTAVRSFLEKDDRNMLRAALSRQVGQAIPPDDIRTVEIYLEKHGAFYHPARAEVSAGKHRCAFVLNVAVSDAGKKAVFREYSVLRKLEKAFPFSYLPKAYGEGQVVTDDGLSIRMFLGDWLTGYSEFHVSQEKTGGEQKIIIWDTEKGNFFLPDEHVRELYARAAMILTAYYDPDTSEQIYPWHHAAGDFVVKCQENLPPEVRLITARDYAAMFASEDAAGENDTESVFEALTLFLLNLSVRMRLDRQDGTGDITWADERVLAGTLDGFFRGMAMKFPDAPAGIFHDYLASWPEHALSDLSRHVISAYHPNAPERPVIQQHLRQHVRNLHQAVRHGAKK